MSNYFSFCKIEKKKGIVYSLFFKMAVSSSAESARFPEELF